MNVSRVGLTFLVFLLALIGSACGTTPTATPEPTEDSLPLTYTSVNGALSMRYPRGWVVDEQGALVGMANNDASMRAVIAQQNLATGQVGAIITPFSAETMALMLPSTTPTVTGLAQLIADNMNSTTGELSGITEVTVNGRSIAYMTLIFDSGDTIAIVVESGGGSFTTLQAVTAPGELPQFQDTLLAIASTITFTPPDASIPESTDEAAP